MTGHSLEQQLIYLRAALEQEKKPVGVLIGAGAPMSIRVEGEPLIPGVEELTSYVLNDVGAALETPLRQLVGHLDQQDQRNLEAILNYVRALAALPGDEPIRGVEMSRIRDLDAAICRVIRGHVNADLPSNDNPYLSLAVWIRAVQRLNPVRIFTTNYDLLIEQGLERLGVAYFDGFVGSRQPVFDIQAVEEDHLPTRWTLLWKLHGSINWSMSSDGNVVREAAGAGNDTSALIYPSHLKYDQSRRLPYLAMLDRLKTFLRVPGAILVSCGFSYRDQHISEVIDQSLRANPTGSVHALLFGELDGYTEVTQLAATLPNLTVLAKDAAVVGGVQGPWIAEVNGDQPGEQVCDLGDFAKFGALLRTLTGNQSIDDAEPADNV